MHLHDFMHQFHDQQSSNFLNTHNYSIQGDSFRTLALNKLYQLTTSQHDDSLGNQTLNSHPSKILPALPRRFVQPQNLEANQGSHNPITTLHHLHEILALHLNPRRSLHPPPLLLHNMPPRSSLLQLPRSG